jgi:hypothetical protein
MQQWLPILRYNTDPSTFIMRQSPSFLALFLATATAPAAFAYSVETAAWSVASSVCTALSIGQTIPQAVAFGFRENTQLWSEELRDPLLPALLTRQVLLQCPSLLR